MAENGLRFEGGEKYAAWTARQLDGPRGVPLTYEEERVATPTQLVEHNRRWVFVEVQNFTGRGVPAEDLICAGNYGLVIASRRFDPKRGLKFLSYARWWVRRMIQDEVDKHFDAVRRPVNLHRDAGKLWRLIDNDRSEMTPDEIAKELEWPTKRVDIAFLVWTVTSSLDVPIYKNGSVSQIDAIPDKKGESPEAGYLKKERKQAIQRILGNLKPRTAEMLEMRYGFNGEPMGLKEIGKHFKVSKERARQIITRALCDLKANPHTHRAALAVA